MTTPQPAADMQEQIDEVLRKKDLIELFMLSKSANKMRFFKPYGKQREFFKLGKTKRERLLSGGNQLGKTECGGFEVSCHVTGLYPDDWEGFKFEYPTVWVVGSVTYKMTLLGIQEKLLGSATDRSLWGTGTIPKHAIVEVVMNSQVKGLAQLIRVRHVSGGVTDIHLTCYKQGREAWQAIVADGVWFDEEPPADIYSEGMTRTNHGNGPKHGYPSGVSRVITTFTPLKGATEVVDSFYPNPAHANKGYVLLGIHDVPMDEEKRKEIIESYPAHIRDARAYGIPTLGEGAVFTMDWDDVLVAPFEIPKHYRLINGIDFGFDHFSAGVQLAIDTDTDTIYVYNVVKVRQNSIPEFAATLRKLRGRWAWPHDGAQHEKGSGLTLISQYQTEGLDVLPSRATNPEDGSIYIEPGIQEMISRFRSGRLKIFKTPACGELLTELRQYHRVKGKPVAVKDDAISALRYAVMMRREARAERENDEIAIEMANRKRKKLGKYGSNYMSQ